MHSAQGEGDLPAVRSLTRGGTEAHRALPEREERAAQV